MRIPVTEAANDSLYLKSGVGSRDSGFGIRDSNAISMDPGSLSVIVYS